MTFEEGTTWEFDNDQAILPSGIELIQSTDNKFKEKYISFSGCYIEEVSFFTFMQNLNNDCFKDNKNIKIQEIYNFIEPGWLYITH